MRERAQELKADTRRGRRADKVDGESAVLAKIDEVRDARLQRQGEPRRRPHVADRLRAKGADRRRRGNDRRAREESGELTTESPSSAVSVLAATFSLLRIQGSDLRRGDPLQGEPIGQSLLEPAAEAS
jgi:hypothetical protein